MRLSTLRSLSRLIAHCQCFDSCFIGVRRSSTVTTQKYDIPVGSSGHIALDIIQPAIPSIQDRNVVIHLPPGPLFRCSGNVGSHVHKVSSILASATHATIVIINYRLGKVFHDSSQGLSETTCGDQSYAASEPGARHYQYPIPVHDTLAGFDWVFRTFQPAKLGVIGTHIGGSLALTLALTEAASIKAVAALDPVCDWPGLDAFCTQTTQQISKATSARRRVAPQDLVSLLEARERLFDTPERYFDAFASPVLFLRSAGKDVPPTIPKYFTGPDYPVPVLKPPPQPRKQIDLWDVHMPPADGHDTIMDDPADPGSSDTYAEELPIRRRKALRRWPPYGLDNGSGRRLQLTLPWVRIFSRMGIEPPQGARSRKPKSARPPTVLAGQASEIVDVMRRACFWGHDKDVGERRVTLARIPSSELDEIQSERAGEWMRETLELAN